MSYLLLLVVHGVGSLCVVTGVSLCLLVVGLLRPPFLCCVVPVT